MIIQHLEINLDVHDDQRKALIKKDISRHKQAKILFYMKRFKRFKSSNIGFNPS